MDELPVKQVMPALAEALTTSGSAVLSAPPGSGKTTLAPLALLTSAWLGNGNILLLEPRRLAARAAAARMAELLGESLGEKVGYTIRLERKVSRLTRIEVVTEGILTRRLQKDPQLQGVGLVIFDEFHERNLHSDLALALTLDVQQGLREDLRLLVMSATLDCNRISQLMGGAPIIEAEGRQYPVTHRYLGWVPDKKRLAEQVTQAVSHAWRRETGDLLVFLPGVGEIRRTQQSLASRLVDLDPPPLICPLYGDLPKADQDRAIRPDKGRRRRIVLTTAIAETSLTIEGVGVVIDSGWSRLPRFLPSIGLTRLETAPVSRAAADQRAGRAGRLGPGSCYRLWSEAHQARLPNHRPPEILQADLAPLALELAIWGVADPKSLNWLDPPPQAAYDQACDLLQRLGAMDHRRRLTPVGRRMAGLPTHPRLAHILLNATGADLHPICDLVALLSERDILLHRTDDRHGVDVDLRLRLFGAWRESREAGRLDEKRCRLVDRVSRDWRRRLRRTVIRRQGGSLSVAQLLVLAYPDRLAQRTGHGRFRLINGRAVRLADDDPLAGQAFLVAAQLDAGQAEGWVRLAAGISESEIRALPDLPIEQVEVVAWDRQSKRVNAACEERLGVLLLKRRQLNRADPQVVCVAMLQGIREMGLDTLPWSRPLRQWQARVCWLGEQLRDPQWPDLADGWLSENTPQWLGAWLEGIHSREQLRRLDLTAILQSLLSWEQRQQVEREAPAYLRAPSGSKIALRYAPGMPPVLAVRLQEMFGLTETPRICRGRVPVTLHLLSPAQRPMQITDDLPGFWKRTYPDVKRELQGRYPKHYWPDDPLQAAPTGRAKPRRR
ncbi:MAG: ATP-dependent helicase HrpB [Candidatus Thiodiazotropha sp. (ex Epidulcina cf. delphinae)]|nr:ATP-dependent helicase HrpB [Candidatus Thiodiazotropha sp. (ex Epidulcina cf. delphinae)]